VLALDLPGHGRSDGPALDSVEALRDWTLALLTAARVERCALVGHSMGSLVALECAAALGERATHLLMLGTAFPMKVSDALLGTARDAPLKAMKMVNTYSHSSWAAKPSAPGPGAWLHGSALALMRVTFDRYAARHGGNLFVTDFSACDRHAGATQAAARVSCPVRFVLGTKDAMTPPKAAAALAKALQADIVTVPAGHALTTEQPDAVLKAIDSFLRR
jgi:pimeloyl-ACP methyl ester carboxylesterase